MKYFQKKSAHLVPMAEEMYVINGRSGEEIAKALNVPKGTVYRWAKDNDWDEKRKRHNNVFRSTLLVLEDKLEKISKDELAGMPLADSEFAGKADAISKLLGQIIKLRNHYDMDMLKMTVIVMEKFARYVRLQQLPEHALEAIETAMSGFFETIKKEHA